MTATDYIADDHRTYAPSLGGVSRDDARQAFVTDARDEVGLRKARKQFAAGFGALAIALGLGAVFYDGDLVLYAGFAAFIALVGLIATDTGHGIAGVDCKSTGDTTAFSTDNDFAGLNHLDDSWDD